MAPDDRRLLWVVDGYSSGSQLAPLMAARGWKTLHVRALPRPAAMFARTFRPNDWIADLAGAGEDGPIDDLVERATAAAGGRRPAAVVPGTESGVILADRLAAALGLPGNDPDTSVARRDKHAMGERVAAAGLAAPERFLARDLESLLAWARAGSWPVVLKPRASAGTDAVTFAADQAALATAFRRLDGTVDQLGQRNDGAVAQRLLVGQEYFVNAVSGAGAHLVTEVWRADKIPVPGGAAIYDVARLVAPATAEGRPIVAFVEAVLEALGVRWGASHTELFVTAEGPVLVESASRLSGGIDCRATGFVLGASQVDLLARLIDEGPDWVPATRAAGGLPPRQPLWNVAFRAAESGVVRTVRIEELLGRLASRSWLQKAPAPGDRLERTVDLFTSPGHVYLSHEDEAVLAADVATLRDWERSGRLFELG